MNGPPAAAQQPEVDVFVAQAIGLEGLTRDLGSVRVQGRELAVDLYAVEGSQVRQESAWRPTPRCASRDEK